VINEVMLDCPKPMRLMVTGPRTGSSWVASQRSTSRGRAHISADGDVATDVTGALVTFAGTT
jgi:hypothetical protein